MGRLHILSITLLFVLDALFAQDAAKFNNQPTGTFYNWYGNEKGNVTCVVNGNPLPVVQWFKGGNQIRGQTSYSISTIEDRDKFQVTSILYARIDLYNEQQILGDYICQGLNAAGVNNITIKMVRAEKPPAPGVSVQTFSARIIVAITTPSVRGPPVSKFIIRYKVQGSNEDPMTIEAPVESRNYVDDQPVPRTYASLENLAVKTNYIITVIAVNDVGESAPYEFTLMTRPYSVPQPVTITSPFPDSMSPTYFLLMWDKPEDGGSEIQKYMLNYREVEVIPNRTLYELSKPLSGFINVDDIPPSAVRYQLSSLIPGTYYQVELQAVNTQGKSTPKSYIFKTKEGVPQPVTIISPFPDSMSPTSFLLMWDKPEDGGSEIQKYMLNYREVEVIPNRTLYELSKPLREFINVDDIPPSAVRYQLSSLIPGTYYQVEVQAVNTQGSSTPKSYIFKTKEGTSVRLVEVKGNPVGSGILEVHFDGQWGSVCDDAFDYRDADVFCRMLGFNKSSHFTSGHSLYLTTSEFRIYPIWMDELNCMGNESDITECIFDGWGRHDCGHHEDVMLFCIFTSTTTPLYPTTSSDSLDSAITSSCSSSGWYIQVDMYRLRQMYPNARESDIYLGENFCTGYSNGNTLVFQHGIRDCLTSETVTQNSIVYRNRLVYVMRDPQYQFIIRGYNWTVEVECDLRSHNTVGSLDPGHVQGTSHDLKTMQFYSDPNFQYEIPGNPLYVKVGTDVYVKVYSDAADWGMNMIVRSCYTKPDPYASDSLKYYIIRDGCEADVNTRYISQSPYETKFMFRDFEYASNHEGLYLYCDAYFCQTFNYSYRCRQSCDPRGKREAESRPRPTETVQEKIIHTRK